jgi:hypothetical protein
VDSYKLQFGLFLSKKKRLHDYLVLVDFYYYFHDFSKIYNRFKNLQKWPRTAVVNDDRDLPPPGTAIGVLQHPRRGYCSEFLPPFPVAAGTTSLKKS